MSENEVKKWFEHAGRLFGQLWAKSVTTLYGVEPIESERGKYHFIVRLDRGRPDTELFYFATESEAKIVRRDIEVWIKSIQGE